MPAVQFVSGGKWEKKLGISKFQMTFIKSFIIAACAITSANAFNYPSNSLPRLSANLKVHQISRNALGRSGDEVVPRPIKPSLPQGSDVEKFLFSVASRSIYFRNSSSLKHFIDNHIDMIGYPWSYHGFGRVRSETINCEHLRIQL